MYHISKYLTRDFLPEILNEKNVFLFYFFHVQKKSVRVGQTTRTTHIFLFWPKTDETAMSHTDMIPLAIKDFFFFWHSY